MERIHFKDGEILEAIQLNRSLDRVQMETGLRGLAFGVAGFGDGARIELALDADRKGAVNAKFLNTAFFFRSGRVVTVSESSFIKVALVGNPSYLCATAATSARPDGYMEAAPGALAVSSVADLLDMDGVHSVPFACVQVHDGAVIRSVDLDFMLPEINPRLRSLVINAPQLVNGNRVAGAVRECSALAVRLRSTVVSDPALRLSPVAFELGGLSLLFEMHADDPLELVRSVVLRLNSCDPHVVTVAGRERAELAGHQANLRFDPEGIMFHLYSHFADIRRRLHQYMEWLHVETETIALTERRSVPRRAQHALYEVVNLPEGWAHLTIRFPDVKASRAKPFVNLAAHIHDFSDQPAIEFERREGTITCAYAYRGQRKVDEYTGDVPLVWSQTAEAEFACE